MRNRGALRVFFPYVVALSLSACTKYNFDDPKADEHGNDVGTIRPIASGRGTQLRPLTVDEVMSGVLPESKSACWVMGYAVGTTRQSMKYASFDAFTDVARNVLLSSDSLCNDVETCIPIELTTKALQQQFSLNAHPEKHRQALVVRGQWGTYFNRLGLRSVSVGYWLPGFDFSSLHATVSWRETDYQY